MYIQRTEPTFLFKHVYSDSPDIKNFSLSPNQFFFLFKSFQCCKKTKLKHTNKYSQNTLTKEIDIFQPSSLVTVGWALLYFYNVYLAT